MSQIYLNEAFTRGFCSSVLRVSRRLAALDPFTWFWFGCQFVYIISNFYCFWNAPISSGALHCLRLFRSSCLDLPNMVKHYRNEVRKQRRGTTTNFINSCVPIMFPMIFPCSQCFPQDIPMFTMPLPRCSQCVAQGYSQKHQGKVSVAKHASKSRSSSCSKNIGGRPIKWLHLEKTKQWPEKPFTN